MVEVRFLQSSEVLAELKDGLRGSRSLKLAVAFLKKSGYGEIRRGLVDLLRRGNPAELVVGISSYGITDYEVLNDLYELKERHGNLSVKYYNNEGFHPKLFLFEFPKKRTRIILGSSNLTGGGVRSNVEANLLLEGTSSEKVIADILEFFKNVFHMAEKLKREAIENCRMACNRARRNRRQSRKRFHIRKTPLIPMQEKGVKISMPSLSPSVLRGRSFWKVAPGKNAWQWPLWKKEIQIDRKGVRRGIIAIGWFNMSRLPFDNVVEFDRAMCRALQRTGFKKSRPGYVGFQARSFYRHMKKRDIVVAYSGSHIHGVAQVEDDKPYHVHIKDWKSEPYENRRTVRWLTLRRWRPEKRFMRVLGRPIDTVHRITDAATIEMIIEGLAGPSFD